MTFARWIAYLCLSIFASSALAERVHLSGSHYSIELPAQFSALADAEIGLKFPGANRPSSAFGNERRTTTIVFGASPSQMSEAQLEGNRESFATSIKAARHDVKFLRNELVDIAGVRWVLFEFRSRAIDGEITNLLLLRVERGQLIRIGLNTIDAPNAMPPENLEPVLRSIQPAD